MPTLFAASVADILALDNLLDGMDDLQRSSIERAIEHRVEEGRDERGPTFEEAAAEYRVVVRDHGDIRARLADLRDRVPETLHETVDDVLALVDQLPDSLESLDIAA